MEPSLNLPEVGKSIADFGFLVMAAATYLVLSATLFFFFMKWFMKIINGIIERQQNILDEILSLEREQTRMLEKIAGTRYTVQGKG